MESSYIRTDWRLSSYCKKSILVADRACRPTLCCQGRGRRRNFELSNSTMYCFVDYIKDSRNEVEETMIKDDAS